MRLFAIIGGLVLTLLIAVLVVPYFINWSDYKGRFETAASQLTGLAVSVDGDAEVRLLPFPSLNFTNVRLGDPADPVALVERFAVDAELAPFLTGELRIFDMRLDGARFVLDPNGQSLQTGRNTAVPDLASIIQDIKLEQATITNGSLLIRDEAGGDAWRIAGLNGTVSADSRIGPFRYAGDGVVNGVPVAGQLTTGRLRADGFSLNTTTQWLNRGIVVSTQGQVVRANTNADSALPDQLHYDGVLQVSPISDQANRLETPFMIEGVFVATDDALTVDQYRASFGGGDDPYTVEGGFSLTGGAVPTYALSARGTQLNWSGLAQGDTGDNFAALLDQARGVLAQLPLPAVAGTVSIDLPAVIYGSTTLRDVRFDAVPAAQNIDGSALWRIERLEAKLPGRTQLEAYGDISLPGQADRADAIAFDGRAVLASRQPSGLATWLGLQSGLAISQMNRAGFEADVRLTTTSQTLNNLNAVVDGDRLQGTVERSVLGARPVLKLALTGDALRDTTFNVIGDLLGAAKPGEANDTDVDLTVNFTESVYRDLYADRLQARLRVRPDQWSVDQFQIDGLFGASLAATATARPDNDGYATDFDVSLVADDGREFITKLPLLAEYAASAPTFDLSSYVAGVTARAGGAFDDVNLTAKGSLRADEGDYDFNADVNGAAGGTTINGTMRFAGTRDAWSDGAFGLDANFRNEQTAPLAAQLGLSIADKAPGDLTVRASGKPSQGMQTTIKAMAVGASFDFDGMVQAVPSVASAQWSAAGSVMMTGRNIGAFAQALAVPVDVSFADPTPFEFAAQATLDPQALLSLSAIDAQAGGHVATGTLSFARQPDVMALEGSLNFSTLDLSPLLKSFAGLSASDDAATAFGANGLANWTARMDIAAQALLAPGLAGAVGPARFGLDLAQNRLEIAQIEATAFGGEVAGRADFQSLGDALLSEFQLSMRDVDLLVLPITQNVAEGRGSVSLAATGSGSSVQAIVGSLTGSGSVAVSDLTINGVDSTGLAPVIDAADRIGFGIGNLQIEDLVTANMTTGRTAFEPVSAPVSLTNGRMRASSIALQSQDKALSGLASLQVDLATGAVDATMDMRFNADNALALAASPGLRVTSQNGVVDVNLDSIQTFLVQRSIEREQQRIAALQQRLNERQRLRRAVRQAAYARDQRLEAERLEAERQEAARLEAERLEAERLEAEQAEERRRAQEIEQRRRAQEVERQQRADNQGVDPFRQEIERQNLPAPETGPTPVPDGGPAIFDQLDFGN